MNRNRISILAAATLSGTLWAYACGDGTTEPPVPPTDVPRPTTVTLSPATAELAALGATVQLSAEVRDQNGQVMAGATVAWTSDNAPVATVDGSGLVTAVAEGTAMITATAGGASGTAEITVHNSDRAALEALYNATDGPNWPRNDNWLTDAPLADWYGVETDGSGRVESLVLGGRPADGLFNGLRGVIPPELGTLTNLKRLQLGKNGLSGAVPPELGTLTSLEELYINNNLLTGPLPAELGNLHKLRILDLSHNGMTGQIPPELGNLSNLGVLNLWENALTGSIPPGLGKLAELTELNLIGNELSGAIPPVLGSLPNLKYLSVSFNDLTGPIPPELGNLAQLEILSLQHNALTGPIPPELGNLDRLWRLWLARNDLTGLIPPDLGNLDKLAHLSLGSNHLTGPIPPELGNLHALESLNVSDNQLSGPIPPELGTLTELQRLYLSGNLLTGSLPLNFLGLGELITLGCRSADSGACLPATDEFREWVQEVEARGNVQLAVDMPFCNEIDAEALEALFDLANGPDWTRSDGWLEDEDLSGWYGVRTDSIGRISSVDLSGNGLSGHLPVALGHLTGMRELRIANNALSGRMPLSLSGVPLQEFDYGGTSLCAPVDAGFQDWLNRVPHLGGTVVPCPPLTDREILEGFHTNVGRSDVIPGWLTSAPLAEWQGVATDAAGRVVELRLVGRDLHGSLPVEFAQLSELRVLDLGGNAFWGPIPPDLGDLDRLELLNLHGNRLTGGIPGALGRLAELRHLALGGNRLSGPVPPELSELSLLERLDLAGNRLSGDIPAELAQLSELRVLDLASNAFGGPIPPALGGLSHLERLDIGRNQLSGSIPDSFGTLAAAEVIDLSDNQLNGPVPPQLGALRHLSELNLSDNRLTGSIPAELAGLSNLRALRLFGNDLTGSIPAALGRLPDLAKLNLGENQLSGPLPAEFGHAVKLEDLDLRSNSLAGPVPAEFGNLTMLTSLILADNPDLVGPLPSEITALDRLVRFMAGGTELCRPADARFDTWFGTIPERRIVRCEGGAAVYLTQTVQSWDDPVPLLAGEPALLRVFVTAPNGGAATMPDVQATFFVDGDERHTVHIPASTASIPHEVTQSDLELSANSEIPASVIVPGLEFVIDVDPEGALDSSLGVTKRIPDSGRISVDVRRVPPFRLTLIPFLSGTEADSSAVQSVREIAADPGGHELVDGVRTLLPVGRIDVSAREPVISSAQDTYILLSQVGAIRLMEGGSGHWMGILGGPPPRGHAYVGGWTSVSSPDARIIAHELGHNLSLLHAPCGFPFNIDPWFPYANGNIGAWGYDLERGALVGPHSVDLMSYCTHGRYWISDYHYNRALDHRLALVGAETGAVAFLTRSLMVWGGRDEEGVPYLDPAFVVEATPSLPPAGGEYTIEGASADGTPIFSYAFDMPVTADADGQEASFVFALPVEPGWGEHLAGITLSGPGGSVSLDESTDRPMAILRDPRTGQIRGFLADYPNGSLAQAAVEVAGAGVASPGLEVLYSRGIPDAPAWNR